MEASVLLSDCKRENEKDQETKRIDRKKEAEDEAPPRILQTNTQSHLTQSNPEEVLQKL